MRLAFLFYFVVGVSCSGNKSDYTDVSNGPRVTHKAWLDIKINGAYAGRIEFGLFGRSVPITVKHFFQLALRHDSFGHEGSRFDLIENGEYIAGGCPETYNFEDSTFDDENFKLKFYGAGWLGMINYGIRDNNSCKFCISLKRLPAFDDKNVVFGKVLNGMAVVERIGNLTLKDYMPRKRVVITRSGGNIVDVPFRVARTGAIE